MTMSEPIGYQELVKLRKACRACEGFEYRNQSVLGYDTGEIGNFTTWANDLNADLMIVAQDYCDAKTYLEDHGLIQKAPLREDAKPKNLFGIFDPADDHNGVLKTKRLSERLIGFQAVLLWHDDHTQRAQDLSERHKPGTVREDPP